MVSGNNFKGILFDFDGVLAETMGGHFRAWKAAMKEYGIYIKGEDYYPLEGTKLILEAKTLCKKYNKNVTAYEEIVRKKVKYYLENPHFRFYPGVEKFIDLLEEKKILKGIISASIRQQLVKSVNMKFLNKFDVIISGDKTSKGKPFPDPYLKGMEELNLQPDECIAIENAPLGIKSAKRAGIYCIAIASTVDKSKLIEADEIIDSFKHLSKLRVIKSLIGVMK